jgi:phage gp46-like protein
MSGDVALLWNDAKGVADFGIASNDLATDDGLRTAVMLSLFCDRQADPADDIPVGADRRGWWADEFANTPGDKIGSRLWTLARAKPVQATLSAAEDFAREALKWLVDDGAARSIDASASFLRVTSKSPPYGYELEVAITKPDGVVVKLKYPFAWAAEAKRTA